MQDMNINIQVYLKKNGSTGNIPSDGCNMSTRWCGTSLNRENIQQQKKNYKIIIFLNKEQLHQERGENLSTQRAQIEKLYNREKMHNHL